jgi:hypothetical protein
MKSLPIEERNAWLSFWKEVDATLGGGHDIKGRGDGCELRSSAIIDHGSFELNDAHRHQKPD